MTHSRSLDAPCRRAAKNTPAARRNAPLPLLLCLCLALCAAPVPAASAHNATAAVQATHNGTMPGVPVTRNGTAATSSAVSTPASLDPAWASLVQRLEGDGFDLAATEQIFSRLGPESYSPAYMGAKILELYGIPGIGINREKAPEPALPDSYEPPVPDVTVGSCLNFIKRHENTLAEIEKKHGVQASAILAVLLIETSLGQDLGKDSALRALASMAATSTPAQLESMGNKRQKARVNSASLAKTLKEKSNWAYTELKALLRYAEQRGCDAAFVPGSIYGAVGLCQFMPSNVEKFGVDGDNDGCIDLFRLDDAMYSVASYLEANGWRGATSDEGRHRVILTYNNDGSYASAVLATSKRLENALKGKGKISLKSSAVVGGYSRNPYARLDPSLRRLHRVPASAKVRSLGDYQQLLQ